VQNKDNKLDISKAKMGVAVVDGGFNAFAM
jgi:hypothetical protein